MSVDTTTIRDALVSHALESGHFEQVNEHEPKNAPGSGITAAVWVDRIEPARSSGLAVTSARMVFNVRLYQNFRSQPEDAIDPALVAALDALMTAYSSDFTLGSNVRCVDLLGMAGVPLSAEAGYLEQDRTIFRVVTITLPLIVNDAWEQVP